MPETILKHASKTAITLTVFAMLFTLCMAAVYTVTKTPIAESEQAARMALFRQIVTDDLHDNDLLNDTISLAPDALLGNKQAIQANVARLKGEASAIVFEVLAHDGYAGDIKLLLAVKADGSLAGVRVIQHKETPGLGDYIDVAKDTWIKLFDHLSLANRPLEQWKVKKDGGSFDYRAGATITPRAVVNAVAKALQYVQTHQQTLFAPQPSRSEQAS